MPIPFLLAGLALGAGALGVGSHISAKNTNQRAQRLAEDAQDLYNSAKRSLEREQNNTEKALLKLGYAKKNTLDSSIKQFLTYYDKIKHIEFNDSIGINELSKFTIDQQAALELREMTNIYSSKIKSGATGAAAGAVIALAASGSLPVVAGGLAASGSALMTGQITAAAGIAGSALSFGAAMTPLAAVAAPVILFTGISASMKADENLHKAKAMYAKAEAASEKMKVSETLCIGITDKSKMFNDLLVELDGMFSQCTNILAGIVRKKEGRFFKKKLSSSSFSEDEIRLIAVTRALAGAVKAVIDTPILSKDGSISYESTKVYNTSVAKLNAFEKEVEEVKKIDFNARPIASAVNNKKQFSSSASSNSGRSILRGARNAFAIILGLLVASGVTPSILNDYTGETLLYIARWFFYFSAITMIVGKFGECLFKNIMAYGTGVSLAILYFEFCGVHDFINAPIRTAFTLFVFGVGLLLLANKFKSSIKRNYLRAIFITMIGASILFLAYYFLGIFMGFFPNIVLVLTCIIMLIFSLVSMSGAK